MKKLYIWVIVILFGILCFSLMIKNHVASQNDLPQSDKEQVKMLEEIADKLQNAEMSIQEKGEKFRLVDKNGREVVFGTKEISRKEMSYLTETLEKHAQADKISLEQMYQDINEAMAEHQNRDSYRIDYDNGMWIKVMNSLNVSQEKSSVENVFDKEMKKFENAVYPNETEIPNAAKQVTKDGIYEYTWTQEVFAGTYLISNKMTVLAEFSNNCNDIEILNVDSINNAIGLLNVDKSEAHNLISNWSYDDNQGLWCEAINQVQYITPACIQVALEDPYHFGIYSNHSCSANQIVRISGDTFHSYGSYYN